MIFSNLCINVLNLHINMLYSIFYIIHYITHGMCGYCVCNIYYLKKKPKTYFTKDPDHFIFPSWQMMAGKICHVKRVYQCASLLKISCWISNQEEVEFEWSIHLYQAHQFQKTCSISIVDNCYLRLISQKLER